MTDTFQSQDDLGALNVYERLNYVLGQVLGVKEFQQEQVYFLNKAQEQNRELHGYGTVKGLEVTVDNQGVIKVSPGLAIDQQGREIRVDKEQCANLKRWLNAVPSTFQIDQSKVPPNWQSLGDLDGTNLGKLNVSKVLYVTLCYAECKTGDQLILGEPCRTDADSVQKTRIRDHFELRLSPTLPQQDEENHVRRLEELLGKIKIDPNLSKPKINNHECEKDACIKTLCAEVDRAEGVSSQNFVIPQNMAYEIFHEVFQYWVAHTRPGLGNLDNYKRLLHDKISPFSNELAVERFNNFNQNLADHLAASAGTSELNNLREMLAKFIIKSDAPILSESDIETLKRESSDVRINPGQIATIRERVIPKAQATKILPKIIYPWRDISDLPNALKEEMNALILDENAVILDSTSLDHWIQEFKSRQQSYLRTGNSEVFNDLPDLKASDATTFTKIRRAIESLPVQDDCILLARLQFNLKQPISTSGKVEVVGQPTVATLQRPYLLHTRLLQELIKRCEQSVNQLLVKTDEIFCKDGKIGIGTSDPETKLHVMGDRIRLESIEQPKKTLDLRADGDAVDLQTETSDLYIHSGKGHHVVLNPCNTDGNIGIRTTTPQDLLEICGANGKGLTLKGDANQVAPFLTIDNPDNPNPSVLTARDRYAFNFEYPVGELRLSIGTTGNVGIGAVNPIAGLDVQPTLTAIVDNEVLTGLHIKPKFENDGKTGVKHYALVVEDGNVDINDNVDIKGDLTVQGRLHLNQPEQHLVRPNDLVAPASRAARLTILHDYPVFTFQEGESASLSLLRPGRIQNEGPPTAYLRLYCTADKAPDNGVFIQWEIHWRWVSAIGPIVPSFPFHEPPLIFPRRPDLGANPLVGVARRIETLGPDKAGTELLPSAQFSGPELLAMRLYGETVGRAYQHYLHISKDLTMEPADNALSADYLAINLKLQTSNGLPTVYLLMAEVRL